ncbi:nucleotidyltransferase [Candidatus Desantisbacteria bacterium CG_4_8_14_3_um_filter_40_12]|uniref:Nucleotidyltransferase n=1 Tax=Candidatus Desantisbacteria bacterium CG_4_8_14_3_um_filter_40_12 TaxID=1974545 RepID=A0A2M7JA66_9BACT|nr:MAG: nucleotidyltransferase [Candidatus Desantisbacteria bacterium CG_4_8_14_3_um_filter_40_12]
MKAVIMAGGFGTRMRPLTCNIPKPMVLVANKPIMEHIVRLLKAHNITEIVAILYYQPEIIQDYFDNGKRFGVHIEYVTAVEDLGTAGSVRNAVEYLDEPFIIISGDVLTDFNLSNIINFHQEKNALATITLTRVKNPLQYGIVIVSPEGRVERFLEKPGWGEVFSDTVNTGIYVLEPETFKHIPENKEFDFAKNLFPNLLKEEGALCGYIASGYWRDIGNLEEYRLAHYDILSGKVSIDINGMKKDKTLWVGKGTELSDNVYLEHGVIIGSDCRIGEGAKLVNTVIGDNCIVEGNSRITNSVIWDGTFISLGCELNENVVASNVTVGRNAILKEGALISDGCNIGENSVLRANVKVWPFKQVEAGATLSSSLIWGEKWGRALFGTNGVVGLANMEITPEFVAKLGAACGASYSPNTTVITSRDSHKVSRMINRALISGILSVGTNVWDLGALPMPVARYQAGTLGDQGGIHVRRASNDPRMLDIKFFNATGLDIPISKERGIEQLFFREDFRRAKIEETGVLSFPYRVMECYREGFLSAIDRPNLKKNFKVVIDYCFGSAATIFPSILGEFGWDVISLNAYLDNTKFISNPAKMNQSLKQLSNIVQTLGADIGFLLDQEAERVSLVDEKGQILSPEIAFAVVCQMVAQISPLATVGTPINTTRIIDQMLPGRVKRTKTTSRGICEEKEPFLVGDGNGGFIFPKFRQIFDGMFAVVKILELLSKTDKRLGDIVAGIPPFFVSHRTVYCSWEMKGTMMRQLIEKTTDKPVELIDGVKIYHGQDWILLLPDQNEASFHLYAESSSMERAEALIDEYVGRIKQ